MSRSRNDCWHGLNLDAYSGNPEDGPVQLSRHFPHQFPAYKGDQMVTHEEAEAISYTQVVRLLAASRTCTLLHRAWGRWEPTPVWAAARHRPRPGSAPTCLSHLLRSKGLAYYQNPFPKCSRGRPTLGAPLPQWPLPRLPRVLGTP